VSRRWYWRSTRISFGIFAAILCIPRRAGDGRVGPDRRLLKLPHQQLQKMEGKFGAASIRLADLSRLNVKYKLRRLHAAMGFSQFPARSGKRFTSLKVMMNTDATDLIWSGDTVAGVSADTPEGPVEIRSELTIGCDGRHSIVRQRANLEVEEIGAPMDVLWFRAGKRGNEERKPVCAARARQMLGHLRSRRLLAMRLRDRQGTIRCGQGGRTGCFSKRCDCACANPHARDCGREKLG